MYPSKSYWIGGMIFTGLLVAVVYGITIPLVTTAEATKTEAPPCKCSATITVNFGSTVPSDAIFINQNDADCFAWAEFISLNWPTAAGVGFGDPGDLQSVQWETYMPLQTLFPPEGAKPPAWGTLPSIPPDCQAQLKKTARGARFLAANARPKLLSATSKLAVNANPSSFPSLIGEAAPANAPNWLGAQNSTPVWYEVRINQDEYNAVVTNGFYNADLQAAWVAMNKPIVLPKGLTGGAVGSIELKAAWMEVPDPTAPQWARYKLSEGVVVDPTTNMCRIATLALVGLHIIHKTTNQPTWIWATFEHVDNAPDATDQNPKGSFNFFNKNCKSQTINVPACALPPKGTSPVTVGCTANTSPPYYLCNGGPGAVPIQVTRVTPIDATATQTNQTIQEAIVKSYSKSVWQYYRLVNVIWSTSPTQDPTTPQKVPLNPASLLPTIPVANSVLETYVQNKTCTDCHSSATIAPTASDPKPPWDSDFSFAIGTATAPPAKKK